MHKDDVWIATVPESCSTVDLLELNCSSAPGKLKTLIQTSCFCRAYVELNSRIKLVRHGRSRTYELGLRGFPECSYKLIAFSVIPPYLLAIAICKGIRILESWKCLLMESGILGFGTRNTTQGIRNPTKECNPESKFHWQRFIIQYLELEIHGVE